jgi:hypothetical protein
MAYSFAGCGNCGPIVEYCCSSHPVNDGIESKIKASRSRHSAQHRCTAIEMKIGTGGQVKENLFVKNRRQTHARKESIP